MVIERLIRDKRWYKNIPFVMKWFATMFIIMLAWQIFRLGNYETFINYLDYLSGKFPFKEVVFTYQYYLTPKVIILLIIAFVGATPFGFIAESDFAKKYAEINLVKVFRTTIYLILMFLSLVTITNSTYSPFIYFQF